MRFAIHPVDVTDGLILSVTSVGGSPGLPPQVAAPLSGGGFSNQFAAPGYQAGDVASYIASLGDQYNGLYNRSGRGIPDVAAQAENVGLIFGERLILFTVSPDVEHNQSTEGSVSIPCDP